MRTQAEVEFLLRRLYADLGRDPADLLQIKPLDGGGWHDALSYEVTRRDGKRTTVRRKDLDDNNEQNVKMALTRFS